MYYIYLQLAIIHSPRIRRYVIESESRYIVA